MRRVRYGMGMSLDGFVADAADGIEWMAMDPEYDQRRADPVGTALVFFAEFPRIYLLEKKIHCDIGQLYCTVVDRGDRGLPHL